jgi:tetratricopeptide (TPR) repeat protein
LIADGVLLNGGEGMRLIEFNGARRVPLVGRRELLKEAERRIGRGGVHLLYFEGEGGIGKTALLEAILEQSQRAGRANTCPACRVADRVIDLYHADVHSSEGLIRSIVEALGKWSFDGTQEVLEALEQARVSGDADIVNQRANALRVVFLEEFSALTEEGVVLALDTLEMLEYEHDPFQEELGAEMPVLSAGEWLFRSFLPALNGNVVLLLAGRPTSVNERLSGLHEQHPRLMVQHIPLEALNREETGEYLKAIAQAEAKRGEGDAAARLWSLCEERGDVIHYLTAGRPILLALVADIVAHGWTLPPLFGRTLQELEQRDAAVLLHDVEQSLAVRVQESPTPIGETIRALAWLRKGATPELLARVMGLRGAEGEWDIYTATGYLDQVAQLALVKIRPGDRRIFLHDEMVALLDVHALQETGRDETDRIYSSIHEYYGDLVRDFERRIEQFPSTAVIVRARLRQALIEQMHYRIRHQPPLGFALYFWLAEEALGGRDTEMDMLVRTECLRTIGMLESNGYFAGFVPREAEMDAAIRWGMRAIFFQGDPERALDIFDEIRRRWGKDAGKLGLTWVHMQLYSALAKIQRAYGDDWQEARILLENVEQRTDEIMRSPPETPVAEGRQWRAMIIKGLTLNFRGYLDRQQGRYLEAVRHYQESAMLQRRLEMAALAPTLTNLAYAMALIGKSHRARLLVEEAEHLARRSGQDHMLAVTLNVRALVELYDDHYRMALHNADRALEAAETLPTFRVRGLIHLTRAKAQRWLWQSFAKDEKQRESEFFEETLKDANQAVTLLRNSPSDRIEALLERGRIYRDMAQGHHLRSETDEAEAYAQRSEADFDRAAVLAGATGIPGQQALAWTEMGWLYYDLEDPDRVRECLRQAAVPLPADYFFPTHGSTPPMAQEQCKREASLHYWSTLGQAEMLKAWIALDEALGAARQGLSKDGLKAAAEHISLSLGYSRLVSDEHFDLTRTEEGLHKRILHDHLSIGALHKYAVEIAEESDLEQPTPFQEYLNRMFGPIELWA